MTAEQIIQMKKQKLQGLDPLEMQSKLREIDEQSFRVKFQLSMGQTEGLKRLRENRKDRAPADVVEAERASSERAEGSQIVPGQENTAPHNQHKNEKVGEVVSTKMQKTIVWCR